MAGIETETPEHQQLYPASIHERSETDAHNPKEGLNMSTSPVSSTEQEEPHDYHHPEQQQQRRRHRGRFRLWLWEILGLIISTASMLSLIAVLAYYQGKQMPAWTSKVSLNTVITLLTMLAKGIMLVTVASCISQLKWDYFVGNRRRLYDLELFDQASRGIQGSLLLLSRAPLNLASVGALLTPVALAVGPFNQQVVVYKNENVWLDSQGASFGFAHRYNTGVLNNGESEQPLPGTLDYHMQGAALKGIYNLDNGREYNCSSSCRWPKDRGSYISLGFGTSCSNVSESTVATKKCHSPPPGSTSSAIKCSMTTPGGVVLNTSHSETESQTVMYVSTNSHMPWNDEMTPSGMTFLPSADFLSVAEYNATNAESQENPQVFTEHVAECMLSLVAFNLSNVVVGDGNSGFTVNEQHKIPLNAPTTMGAGGNGDIGNITYILSSNDTDLPTLSISFYDWAAIGTFLKTQFFNVTVGEGVEEQINLDIGSALTAPSAGTVDTWLPRVAESMSSQLRSKPNIDLAYGQVRETVIIIHVVWGWLVLPLAVLAGTILLTIFTIWKSTGFRFCFCFGGGRSKKVNPSSSSSILWKSSILALLFHHLEDDVDGDDGAYGSGPGPGSGPGYASRSNTVDGVGVEKTKTKIMKNMLLVPDTDTDIDSQESFEKMAKSTTVRLATGVNANAAPAMHV